MKIKVTSRTIWSVSFPIIIAGVGEKIVEITDTIFLSRYGLVELGAIGLADSMYELVIFLTVGLTGGLQIMIARRAGEGFDREIGRVFNHGMYLLLVVSVVLTAGLRLASSQITDIVTSSEQIGKAVDDFLQIYAFAILFRAVNMAYGALYVGLSRTRILMGATAVLAVTNIFLDYALIFGNLGMPRLGIKGAAWGSLAAEIAAFVLMTGYALTRLPFRRYGLFKLEKWRAPLTRSVFSISSPLAVETVVETARWFAFFVIIERMGEVPLAMANVVYACFALFVIPIEGLSEVSCTMVSNLIGQGKATRIGPLLRRTVYLGALVVLPVLGVAAIAPEYLLSVFSGDPSLIQDGVASLRVVLVATAIIIVAEIFASAVAGTGDTTATLVIEVIFAVSSLAYAYVTAIVLGLNLEWVWMGEIVGWSIVLALSYFWLKKGYWRRLEI